MRSASAAVYAKLPLEPKALFLGSKKFIVPSAMKKSMPLAVSNAIR